MSPPLLTAVVEAGNDSVTGRTAALLVVFSRRRFVTIVAEVEGLQFCSQEIRRQGSRSSKRRRKGKLLWWIFLCFVKVKKVSCTLHSCLRC
ncbi:hypothetical protein V2J09_004213 [Rumex salicifolius]